MNIATLFQKIDFCIEGVKDNFYYAFKSVRSILSGYKGLEKPEWVECDDLYIEKVFVPIEGWDDGESSYYVCATFNNGRHLPLPIVLDRKSDYPLQDIAIRLLSWHPAFKKAYAECQKYSEINY